MKPQPRHALFVAAIASLLAIIGLSLLTIDQVRYRINENDRQCEREVKFGDDIRRMWTATFDFFPDSPEVRELRETLDRVQPPLMCVDGKAVPIQSIN